MNDDATSTTWAALRALPLSEVRRRAAVITEVTEIGPMTVDGAERFAWNDSGGQSAVWYFTADGRALLLTFDHESPLNLYAEDDYALQRSMYDGVPEDLLRLVLDRPENYESLNLTDPRSGGTIHYAGGVFWFDAERWHIADGTRTHCAREQLDLFVESGFDYCLSEYLLDTPDFTAEALVKYRAGDGYYEDEEDSTDHLVTLTEIFARHA
ncbi:hypothetical protein RCO28_19785 [Streptomyces sp. LHD-70]|uniref:hypothetical protein n=1 Tax=Streptomyces sp. LHD-70 TaxID=3072140 RepID=UPI00280CDCA0|nr:hypothetical protein [Streptomyces sp. LHD-70]MDQ8704716.1 hypothetical protein [Streptomyces sp. LHD-70]